MTGMIAAGSRRALLCGTVAAALLMTIPAPGSAQTATPADKCAAPAEITANIAPIPQTAAVLKPGGSLDVLVVGSATVFSPSESLKPGSVTGLALGLGGGPRGGDLMASDAAFPLQMAKDLQASIPGLKVSVTVKGGRGMTAVDMLAILRTELAAHHYQLVVWQTGTVEAVQNVPAGAFYQTLSDGAEAVAGADADLVLIDPQFSRFLRTNADLDPYAQAFQQIAGMPGVVLFHRFELMRYWSGEGQIDLERTPKGQRVKAVETLHACLGASLATFIEAAAHLPP